MELPFRLTDSEHQLINKRIAEFKKVGSEDTDRWFSELCFCILTANARADKAISIQEELGASGFLNKPENTIANVIRSYAHRFYNVKAHHIVLARPYHNIKNILASMSSQEARLFLVKNIKGIGFKEASHFLRNVGYEDVAIIDRHILKFLLQSKLIDQIPKSVTPKKYFDMENLLKKFNIKLNKLDLMIWCHITGKILK